MTDVKTITSSGIVHNATITQTQEITSSTTPTPEIIAQPTQTELVVPNYTDVLLASNITNMGEDNVPDPSLWKLVLSGFNTSDFNTKLIKPRLSELLTTTELISKNIQPIFADVSLSYELLTKSIDKDIQNYVNPTDDFFGLANLDDDQSATVGKSVVDTVVLPPDSLLFVVLKHIDTMAIATDINEFLVDKQLTDVISSQDLLTRVIDYNRQFTELKNTQEIISKLLSIILPENYVDATSIEFISKLIGFNLSDSFITSDIVTRTVTFIREFNTLVDATDDFDLTNLDDDQIASVVKVLANTATSTSLISFNLLYNIINNTNSVLDQLIILANKVFDETINSTSSITKFDVAKVEQEILHTISVLNFNVDTILPDDYVNNLLSTVIFESNISKADSTVLLDNTQKLIESVFNTTAGTLDNLEKSISSNLLDTINSIDLFSATSLKIFTETLSPTSQQIILLIEKYLTDTQFLSDAITEIVFNKSNADQLGLLEIISKSTETSTQDSLTGILDFNTIITNKALPESITTTSSITNFILDYHLFDLVDATDDFDLTNLDDDQIASVLKVLLDSVGNTDIFNRSANYIRDVNNVIQGLDTSIISFNKAPSDNIVSNDSIRYYLLQKQLTENTLANDLFSRVVDYKRSVLDTLPALSEIFTKAIGKNFIENKTATETISKIFTKDTILESLTATENFVKSISPGTKQETITNIETFIKNYQTSNLENLTANDLYRLITLNKIIPTENLTATSSPKKLVSKPISTDYLPNALTNKFVYNVSARRDTETSGSILADIVGQLSVQYSPTDTAVYFPNLAIFLANNTTSNSTSSLNYLGSYADVNNDGVSSFDGTVWNSFANSGTESYSSNISYQTTLREVIKILKIVWVTNGGNSWLDTKNIGVKDSLFKLNPIYVQNAVRQSSQTYNYSYTPVLGASLPSSITGSDYRANPYGGYPTAFFIISHNYDNSTNWNTTGNVISQSGSWKTGAGDGTDYQVRFTAINYQGYQVSGSSLDTWLNLSTSRYIAFAISYVGTVTSQVKCEIRATISGQILTTSNINLTVQLDSTTVPPPPPPPLPPGTPPPPPPPPPPPGGYGGGGGGYGGGD